MSDCTALRATFEAADQNFVTAVEDANQKAADLAEAQIVAQEAAAAFQAAQESETAASEASEAAKIAAISANATADEAYDNWRKCVVGG